MALVKCTNCGHSISDKAVKCPKCGMPAHKIEEVVKPINKHHKVIVEDEKEVSYSNNVEMPSEEYVKTSYNNIWKVIGLILFVFIVIMTGIICVLYYNQEKDQIEVENVTVPAVFEDETETLPVVHEESAYDTLAIPEVTEYDDIVVEEEEDGFLTDDDVLAYVCGNRYFHDDITLMVTEEGIFANGNKLGDSPRFKRLSNEKGIIRTSGISITVKRENNTLIDNNSGDIYYMYYSE